MKASRHPQHRRGDHGDDARRHAALRTAWIAGGIALAVYAGFLLLGVFGR